jgi:hypothetical protein
MARKTKKNYAEKILKTFGNEAGGTQNKADNSAILSELKKRLNDLSKKIRSGRIIYKAIEKHNRKASAGHKVLIKAEIAEELYDVCERVYDEAYSIFSDAADAGIRLPSVPAVDGKFWDFKLLQSWHNESLREISKPQKHIPEKNGGGTNKLSKEAKVLAALADNPELSDADIAKKAGVNRTSLYRMKKFKKTKEILKRSKEDLPRGSKSKDGDMEAWNE